MDNNNIERLIEDWQELKRVVITTKEVPIEQIEYAFKETYRICTEYCDKTMVPKELSMLFVHIERFLRLIIAFYGIDEISSPSDSAGYLAIGEIYDEILDGFLSEKYECAYPQLTLYDNKFKPYVINLEKPYLEDLIESKR